MHPVTPVRTYVLIWAILTIMTFTTYFVAQIDLGPFNTVVALMIARPERPSVATEETDIAPTAESIPTSVQR